MGESSVLDRIEHLRASADNLVRESAKLESVLAAYPDAKFYTGRWDKRVICSASVNSCVDQYEHRFNCGCCPDSPLEVWSYLETPNGRVYSAPACFFIGERTDASHNVNEDWDAPLIRAGINAALVDRIRSELTTVPKSMPINDDNEGE